MNELTHLSLFSGIGGLDLAAEWAGFRTVGQCEWADYPRAVLEKHWPGMPRWKDIRTLTGDDFYEKTGLRTVTVVSGGFPCQPFSVAGKREGKEDDRYLWPEMLRVIQEIRPTWVVGENVAGLISMALDTVLSDLESIGYATQAFVIPACAVDAPHRRDRVAIVGYTEHDGLSSATISGGLAEAGGDEPERQNQTSKSARAGVRGDCENVANSKCEGQQGCEQHGTPCDREPCCAVGECSKIMANADFLRQRKDCNQSDSDFKRDDQAPKQDGGAELRKIGSGGSYVSDPDSERFQIARYKPGIETVQPENGIEFGGWWPAEPDVGRVANGVPNRVDRLKCLGNAVVPQQFYPIFRAIADLERMGKEIS